MAFLPRAAPSQAPTTAPPICTYNDDIGLWHHYQHHNHHHHQHHHHEHWASSSSSHDPHFSDRTLSIRITCPRLTVLATHDCSLAVTWQSKISSHSAVSSQHLFSNQQAATSIYSAVSTDSPVSNQHWFSNQRLFSNQHWFSRHQSCWGHISQEQQQPALHHLIPIVTF